MIYFREVQRLWAWVLLLLALATPAIVLTTALHRSVGTQATPGRVLYVVYGSIALLAVWFSLASLIVEVREPALSIRFSLLWPERILRWHEIQRAEATTYRPMEYGGWGVRRGARGMAYTVRGNRGVRIELRNGEEVLIGSQRADELADAIAERTTVAGMGTRASDPSLDDQSRAD